MTSKQDYRDEAKRLALLARSDQAAVIAMYRDLADNPLATPACRTESRAKAKALENLLGLPAPRKPGKASETVKKGKPPAKARRKQ
jgi:hypothetical protein